MLCHQSHDNLLCHAVVADEAQHTIQRRQMLMAEFSSRSVNIRSLNTLRVPRLEFHACKLT